MIGTKKASESLSRCRKSYQLHGIEGFFEERRGKESTLRPRSKLQRSMKQWDIKKMTPD